MTDERALQVSHQTREMIEHGAQAMIQQAMEYMRDAIHAPQLRKENIQLVEEVVKLKVALEELQSENGKLNTSSMHLHEELLNVKASRDLIVRHRDQLMSESAQLTEKFRRLRHSMDTMRGIMDSNLAA